MEDEYEVPRGGPIYLQDAVGELLTTVTDFETSIVQELQSLIAELNSADDDDDMLSVDELKVLSEEELVQKAFQDTFPLEEVDAKATSGDGEGDRGGALGQVQEGDDKDANATSGDGEGDRGGALSQVQEGVDNDSANSDNDKKKKKMKQKQKRKQKRKRGRKFDRETRAPLLESPILVAKVEQVAQIKQKQEEDKLAARLHSFSGGSKLTALSSSSSSSTQNLGKMQTLKFTSSDAKVKTQSNVHQHVPITYPEVILCVEVYNAKKSWVKSQELLVLGSQRLSHLRDQIDCLTDQLMHKASKSDPSGYFLIENYFCNDKRDPSAIDYSEPITEWINNSKDEVKQKWESIQSGELQPKQIALFGCAPIPPVPGFQAFEMDKIRFCDLSFKLGAAYLYCHQGACKHNIVIRDMRLIHPEDIQNRTLYPLLMYQHKNRYNKCSVCNIYLAKKVTLDDKWAQENPCYFCDNCYYLLHYKEDGTLLYSDFTVYDYYHE